MWSKANRRLSRRRRLRLSGLSLCAKDRGPIKLLVPDTAKEANPALALIIDEDLGEPSDRRRSRYGRGDMFWRQGVTHPTRFPSESTNYGNLRKREAREPALSRSERSFQNN